MSEPTYTLKDARRVMAQQQCATYGHEWNVTQARDAGPVRIACDSCGWSGSVAMGPLPEPVRPATERTEP